MSESTVAAYELSVAVMTDGLLRHFNSLTQESVLAMPLDEFMTCVPEELAGIALDPFIDAIDRLIGNPDDPFDPKAEAMEFRLLALTLIGLRNALRIRLASLETVWCGEETPVGGDEIDGWGDRIGRVEMALAASHTARAAAWRAFGPAPTALA